MEVKQSNQYYLYNSQTQANDLIMVEENKLLKQLQEAVLCSKDDHSEDELSAAVGMMLMHYQAVVIKEPEYSCQNKFAAQIQQQKQRQLKPKLSITKVHTTATTQNIRIDSMKQQIRKNRKSNYNKSSLLASCRNILKEFLSQNSL